jgi:WD40 repeat protein
MMNPMSIIRATVALVCLLTAGAALAQPFVPKRDAHAVAASLDGKLLATGISGMSSGELPPRPHPTPSKCAEIKLWNADNSERVRRVEWFGDVTRLAFSPDGKLLGGARLYRTSDGLDLNEVRIWKTPLGEVVRSFDRAHTFDFSPATSAIAVCTQRSCTIFDLATGQRLRKVKPLGGAIAVRYSPDGKQLVGIVRSEQGYQLRACDAATGKVLAEGVALDEPFYSLDVAARGGLVATGHAGGNVIVWHLDTLEPVKRFNGGDEQRQRAIFSPDGETLACCGQAKADIVLFDIASGRELRRMHYEQGTFHTLLRRRDDELARPEEDPQRFAFTPDGQAFIAGPYGGVLRSVATGNEVQRLVD